MTSLDGNASLLARAIARPMSVLAAVALVLFFGVLAIADLPIQLTPDISVPTITIQTDWPGASPVEVESELLDEQEEVLKRVQGLERMTSNANLNRGQIRLELAVGTDLNEAIVRVSNQLSQVRRRPQGAYPPVVTTSNASGPLLAVILVRDDEGHSVSSLRSWVLEEIVPELERVHGVAGIWTLGGQDSEIHIDFRARALAARGLTVPDLATRIGEVLRSSSAGDVTVGKRRMLVRTRIAPENLDEFRQLIVKVDNDGSAVRLGDVATIELGLRRRGNFAFGDDRDSLALLARREAGTNVLEVTQQLRAVVERLHAEHFASEGLTLEVVDDQTGFINEALAQVRSNLLFGALLATLVLLLFLRSVVASAIIAFAIPICVLGTALCMTLLGRSVNVVSLAGITFAVGMVVDNSIVALENIDTWRRRTPNAAVAALRAITEVWGALLASTATTAAVFLPILLWQGEVGELLRDIAYAIAISVILSLVVSVLVIPSIATRWLGNTQLDTHSGHRSASRRGISRLLHSIREGIGEAIAFLSTNKRRSLAVVGFAGISAAAVAIALLPKMEYLPRGNRNLIFGIVRPAPGHSVEELRRTGMLNQAIMAEHTGKQVGDVPAVHRSFFVGDPGQMFVGAIAEDPQEVGKLREFMQKLHAKIPGVINFATQAALFSGGIGEGRAINLELSGPDTQQLTAVARSLMAPLQQLIAGASVRPNPALDDGAAELHIVPRRQRLGEANMTERQLALIADTYVDGAIIGEFSAEGQRKRDVVLRAVETLGANQDEHQLAATPVATAGGTLVPFGVLAQIETRLGPMAISRLERRRAITLLISPPDEVPFESAVDAVTEQVAQWSASGMIPGQVQARIAGSAGRLSKAQGQFTNILLVALVISYLLLTGLFENTWAPIAVMIAIPLAAAGGVVALVLANALGANIPLDLMSGLGFVILIGVVVNNAILIVDGALARLRQGDALPQALGEAVRGRVRPIFMSTLTSLFGLAPMVTATGPGSELYRGIGTVLLGGLSVSTVLSLAVVPCTFALLWRLGGAKVSLPATTPAFAPQPSAE